MDTLEQKAKQGDAKAMLELADRYYKGNCVEQHLSNALHWWKAATNTDDAEVRNQAIGYLVDYYIKSGDYARLPTPCIEKGEGPY